MTNIPLVTVLSTTIQHGLDIGSGLSYCVILELFQMTLNRSNCCFWFNLVDLRIKIKTRFAQFPKIQGDKQNFYEIKTCVQRLDIGPTPRWPKYHFRHVVYQGFAVNAMLSSGQNRWFATVCIKMNFKRFVTKLKRPDGDSTTSLTTLFIRFINKTF